MIVEKGVPKSPIQVNDATRDVGGGKTSDAGEGVRKRRAGFPEACADEDDDEDD